MQAERDQRTSRPALKPISVTPLPAPYLLRYLPLRAALYCFPATSAYRCTRFWARSAPRTAPTVSPRFRISRTIWWTN